MEGMTQREEDIHLNLKQIFDGLKLAVEGIERAKEENNLSLLHQSIAVANITLFEGMSIRQIKKLLKEEDYR